MRDFVFSRAKNVHHLIYPAGDNVPGFQIRASLGVTYRRINSHKT